MFLWQHTECCFWEPKVMEGPAHHSQVMCAHLIDKKSPIICTSVGSWPVTSQCGFELRRSCCFFQLCPLNWPVSTCIHYCHCNFSPKAEVTIPSSLRDQTGDMDSEACSVRRDRTWWGPWQTSDCPPNTQQMRQLHPVPTWSLPMYKVILALPELPSFLGKPETGIITWNFLSFQQGNKIFRAPIFKFAPDNCMIA